MGLQHLDEEADLTPHTTLTKGIDIIVFVSAMECGDDGTQVNGGSVDDANNAESIIVESQNRVENAISIAEETYEEFEMRNEMWVNDEYKDRDKWGELFVKVLVPGTVPEMLRTGKVTNQTPKASKTKLVRPKTSSKKKSAHDHQWRVN